MTSQEALERLKWEKTAHSTGELDCLGRARYEEICAALQAQTMQFHGAADIYVLTTGTTIATLYPDAHTPTSFPAVAINTYGTGVAVLFAYDLAESIALMRHGNPAWSGYPNNHDGFRSMRPAQLFMDITTGAFWNDLGDGTSEDHRNDVPQADEQMRLFSHIIILENAARLPLPRIWYFPEQKRALLLMTADAHENYDDALSTSIIRVVESYGGLPTIYLWHPYKLVGSDSVSRWMNPGHEVGIHFNDMSDTEAGISRGSRLHRLRAMMTRFGLRRFMPD